MLSLYSLIFIRINYFSRTKRYVVSSVNSLINRFIRRSTQDNRSLREIYNTLSSPCVYRDDSSRLHPLAADILSGGNIPGLQSTLHQYQQRSVAAMIQRELDPGTVSDPLYIPIVGVDGKEFYLDPATMEVLRERPTVSQARSGILCEEMGRFNHMYLFPEEF